MAQTIVCLQCRRSGFDPWIRKIPGEWGGYPLQYSCLENPMDKAAYYWASQVVLLVKNLYDKARVTRGVGLIPVKMLWRQVQQPTPVLLPGESHGWRSLVDCSPWGRWGSDTTERLHFHFSLSCIGEGNGNPLQYSCLENPRDGGAWWAAVYGVA